MIVSEVLNKMQEIGEVPRYCQGCCTRSVRRQIKSSADSTEDVEVFVSDMEQAYHK